MLKSNLFFALSLFLSVFPLYSMELSKPRLKYAQKATTEIPKHLEVMRGPEEAFTDIFKSFGQDNMPSIDMDAMVEKLDSAVKAANALAVSASKFAYDTAVDFKPVWKRKKGSAENTNSRKKALEQHLHFLQDDTESEDIAAEKKRETIDHLKKMIRKKPQPVSARWQVVNLAEDDVSEKEFWNPSSPEMHDELQLRMALLNIDHAYVRAMRRRKHEKKVSLKDEELALKDYRNRLTLLWRREDGVESSGSKLNNNFYYVIQYYNHALNNAAFNFDLRKRLLEQEEQKASFLEKYRSDSDEEKIKELEKDIDSLKTQQVTCLEQSLYFLHKAQIIKNRLFKETGKNTYNMVSVVPVDAERRVEKKLSAIDRALSTKSKKNLTGIKKPVSYLDMGIDAADVGCMLAREIVDNPQTIRLSSNVADFLEKHAIVNSIVLLLGKKVARPAINGVLWLTEYALGRYKRDVKPLLSLQNNLEAYVADVRQNYQRLYNTSEISFDKDKAYINYLLHQVNEYTPLIPLSVEQAEKQKEKYESLGEKVQEKLAEAEDYYNWHASLEDIDRVKGRPRVEAVLEPVQSEAEYYHKKADEADFWLNYHGQDMQTDQNLPIEQDELLAYSCPEDILFPSKKANKNICAYVQKHTREFQGMVDNKQPLLAALGISNKQLLSWWLKARLNRDYEPVKEALQTYDEQEKKEKDKLDVIKEEIKSAKQEYEQYKNIFSKGMQYGYSFFSYIYSYVKCKVLNWKINSRENVFNDIKDELLAIGKAKAVWEEIDAYKAFPEMASARNGSPYVTQLPQVLKLTCLASTIDPLFKYALSPEKRGNVEEQEKRPSDLVDDEAGAS